MKDIKEIVAKNLVDLRKKNNLTQKQLADKYNVTYQAVSKWENGKNMPDFLGTLQRVERFFYTLTVCDIVTDR